jgi:hypothetical protein
MSSGFEPGVRLIEVPPAKAAAHRQSKRREPVGRPFKYRKRIAS